MLDSEFGESKDMFSNMASAKKPPGPRRGEYGGHPGYTSSPGMTKQQKM